MHTPGPWAFLPLDNNGARTLATDDRTKTHLVSVYDAPGMGRAADANRNLIAAAPDLLLALEAIVAIVAPWPKPGMKHQFEAAVDAINKARRGKC